jgi:hypothetical protein
MFRIRWRLDHLRVKSSLPYITDLYDEFYTLQLKSSPWEIFNKFYRPLRSDRILERESWWTGGKTTTLSYCDDITSFDGRYCTVQQRVLQEGTEPGSSISSILQGIYDERLACQRSREVTQDWKMRLKRKQLVITSDKDQDSNIRKNEWYAVKN